MIINSIANFVRLRRAVDERQQNPDRGLVATGVLFALIGGIGFIVFREFAEKPVGPPPSGPRP